MRPAALMRGPIWNTILLAEHPSNSTPAFSASAAMPTRGDSPSCLRPARIRTRFSPTIGTMSQAVLTATRSKNGQASSGGRPNSPRTPWISLKPTPHPLSPLNG